MKPGDKAWIVMGVGIAAYEAAALPDQLLSDRCDVYLSAHPWLTRVVVSLVALHLVNAFPSENLDPLHWLFAAKRRLLR